MFQNGRCKISDAYLEWIAEQFVGPMHVRFKLKNIELRWICCAGVQYADLDRNVSYGKHVPHVFDVCFYGIFNARRVAVFSEISSSIYNKAIMNYTMAPIARRLFVTATGLIMSVVGGFKATAMAEFSPGNIYEAGTKCKKIVYFTTVTTTITLFQSRKLAWSTYFFHS